MICTCQIWEQKKSKINKISELQDKSLRIINFRPTSYPVVELHKNSTFVGDTLTATQIPAYKNYLKKTREIHRYNTRHTSKDTVEIPQPITETYDKYYMHFQAATA